MAQGMRAAGQAAAGYLAPRANQIGQSLYKDYGKLYRLDLQDLQSNPEDLELENLVVASTGLLGCLMWGG